MKKSTSFPATALAVAVLLVGGTAVQAQVVNLQKEKLTSNNTRSALIGNDSKDSLDLPDFTGNVVSMGIQMKPAGRSSAAPGNAVIPVYGGASTGAAPTPAPTPHKETPRAESRGTCRKSGRGLTASILFSIDSSAVSAPDREELGVLVGTMQDPELQGCSFVIEGHTDMSGSPEHNLALSKARAQSVIRVFTDAGLSGGRLRGVGYGAGRLADSQNPYAEVNRRVTLLVE